MWLSRTLFAQHYLPPWVQPAKFPSFLGTDLALSIPKVCDREECTIPRLASQGEIDKVNTYQDYAKQMGAPILFYASRT